LENPVGGITSMSYAINPERIEEEIISSHRYDTDCTIDSFTLNKKRFELERVIDAGKFNEKTFIALGLILFNMKEYRKFVEHYKNAFNYFPTSMELHAHRILGFFRMFNYKLYPVGDFDLFSEWFDNKINIEKHSLTFGFGSRRIIYAGKELVKLCCDNNALVTLNKNRTFHFNFGPFEYDTGYDEMNGNESYFDETFSWNIVERIRNEALNEEQEQYLKEILGGNYNSFISSIDPDYTEYLTFKEEEIATEEIFDSVEDFIASL